MSNEVTAALGSSQKDFYGEIFVLRKPSGYAARILQFRIMNAIGEPFSDFMSAIQDDTIDDVEQLILRAITKALNSVEPDVSVKLIKDLCEMTINQSKGRQTSYDTDFDTIESTKDIEIAIWVVQETLGKFLSALSKSSLPDQILSKLLVPEDEETKKNMNEDSNTTAQM